MIGLPIGLHRKEACARQMMAERNLQTGPVCMLSTVEPCFWALLKGNQSTNMLERKMAPRKCVWIYPYWNDEQLGFGHTRLQTWQKMRKEVNDLHRRAEVSKASNERYLDPLAAASEAA